MRNNAAYLPESPIVYIILPKSIRNRASFRIFVRINAGRSETFVRSPHDCGSGETPSPSGGNNTKADR